MPKITEFVRWVVALVFLAIPVYGYFFRYEQIGWNAIACIVGAAVLIWADEIQRLKLALGELELSILISRAKENLGEISAIQLSQLYDSVNGEMSGLESHITLDHRNVEYGLEYTEELLELMEKNKVLSAPEVEDIRKIRGVIDNLEAGAKIDQREIESYIDICRSVIRKLKQFVEKRRTSESS